MPTENGDGFDKSIYALRRKYGEILLESQKTTNIQYSIVFIIVGSFSFSMIFFHPYKWCIDDFQINQYVKQMSLESYGERLDLFSKLKMSLMSL